MRLFAGNGPFPANCYYMGNEMGYALVADCDRKAGAAAAETLESAGWHVAFMESGRGAIEAVQSSRFDLLIISLVLMEWDGLAVLERLPALRLRRYPYTAVLTALGAPLRARALSLGADCALAKPVSSQTLREIALQSQSEMSRLSASAAEKRRESARQCVASLGVPEHLKGFEYLSDAVALCSADDRLLSRATTLLYPRVAARFEATPGGVEHAVRQAIETTWTRGRMETLARLFGNSIDPQRGKPTYTECIALLAEQLRKAYE